MYSAADLEQADRLARALRALAHPARVLALRALAAAQLSPIELTRLLDRREYDLGVVAYHVRRLNAAGIVELKETIPRRGAVEHRYALSSEGVALEQALRGFWV
jgi:DNA-binding transcriptional ArsR family regulator